MDKVQVIRLSILPPPHTQTSTFHLLATENENKTMSSKFFCLKRDRQDEMLQQQS